MQEFRKLVVWKKAHELALLCYRSTSTFPREELYGLTSQIRRASASIPTNIAEGCGRSARPDFARFLTIAAGSASEVEYLLLLAHDLGFLTPTDYRQADDAVVEVKRMLSGLIRRLTTEN